MSYSDFSSDPDSPQLLCMEGGAIVVYKNLHYKFHGNYPFILKPKKSFKYCTVTVSIMLSFPEELSEADIIQELKEIIEHHHDKLDWKVEVNK